MKTEIFLENEQLDISTDLSALLTLAIDDVRDFSSRQTSFSKTIVLPGTAKNNRVFGHIYDVGQANVYDQSKPNLGYNFNASKSAACLIFQDNIQTFKGVLRILQINIVEGRIEYEVSVFGDLFLLNAKLSGGLLENLDFSGYDHIYNHTSIINSWDNIGGSGYYYPLIDHGDYSENKHDWDIRTFRPSLYVKEYIDKMFAAAGFRYQSSFFNSERFRNLIVPFNRKRLTTVSGKLMEISNTNVIVGFEENGPQIDLGWQTIDLSSAFISGDNIGFSYQNTETLPVRLHYSYEVLDATYVPDTVGIFIQGSYGITGLPPATYLGTGGESYSGYVDIELRNGDFLVWRAQTTYNNVLTLNMSAYITLGVPTQIDVNPGSTIRMTEHIPKNIRQVDFLVSIVKLFNLYILEDKFDDRLLHITPFVDLFGSDNTDATDWTYKLNRKANIQLKPMSELNAKLYKFQYKSDSDYYNDLYNKRYGMVYGGYNFDSQFEFADQTKSFELIFAPTPLVGYEGEEKTYPTIFKRTGTEPNYSEEQCDSVIRIMQAKKITGVTSWNILNKATLLTSLTDYGYAGHFDDPDAPTNDLNFGALKELFFVLANGTLSNTQFNLYWSSYMAEITDKDSKLLTASFYLTPADIYNLDFSKYITIDGVLFRLNKISDYNLSNPGECQVELLKVNYTLY